jgi:hypothetical protein
LPIVAHLSRLKWPDISSAAEFRLVQFIFLSYFNAMDMLMAAETAVVKARANTSIPLEQGFKVNVSMGHHLHKSAENRRKLLMSSIAVAWI